jgi:hypothetical protein
VPGERFLKATADHKRPAKKGEGLHHVKLYYLDYATVLARFAALGYQVFQSGRMDENEFHYFDTWTRSGT